VRTRACRRSPRRWAFRRAPCSAGRVGTAAITVSSGCRRRLGAVRRGAGGDHDHGRQATRRRADDRDRGAVGDAAAMRWHGRRVTVYASAEPTDMGKA